MGAERSERRNTGEGWRARPAAMPGRWASPSTRRAGALYGFRMPSQLDTRPRDRRARRRRDARGPRVPRRRRGGRTPSRPAPGGGARRGTNRDRRTRHGLHSNRRRHASGRVREGPYVVTKGRCAWADRYVEGYLRARRTSALEGAAERYHVSVNTRGGKPPTLKQTARDAATATNLRQGGDLGAFYRLIRERSLAPIENGRRATRSPDLALAHLYGELAALDTADDADVSWTARRLLKPATAYVRWLEATGEAPGPDRVEEFEYNRASSGTTAVRRGTRSSKRSTARFWLRCLLGRC